MANIPAAYALSVRNGSITTQEDLYEIGLNQFDYKVKLGDVLEVPHKEDLYLKKVCPPGIPGYDIYAAVLKNEKLTWILTRRVIRNDRKEIALYDLAEQFHYPGDTGDLLTFLGDLECPITVTKDGLTW